VAAVSSQLRYFIDRGTQRYRMIVSRAGVEIMGRRGLRTRRVMVLASTSKKNFQLKLALSAPVLALAPCFLFYASTAAADDSWQNLKHVTRERYYTVVDRKSNCITGHIVKTNDRELTLKLPNRAYATFDRPNVLRVSVSQAAPNFPPRVQADVGRVYDVIYNDKSSWSDLKGLAGQQVKVVKTSGETYEGHLLITSETHIELDRTGGKLEFAKVDIAQVFHLRPKPLTDSEKYSAQEDFWMDPRLWPYYFNLVPRLDVRFYDSSLPDDNTPVRCENDSRENAVSNTPSPSCFMGYVQTIDPPSLTLRPRDKDPITMQVSKDAHVWEGGKHISVGEIKVGDQGVACGSETISGFIADRINIHR